MQRTLRALAFGWIVAHALTGCEAHPETTGDRVAMREDESVTTHHARPTILFDQAMAAAAAADELGPEEPAAVPPSRTTATATGAIHQGLSNVQPAIVDHFVGAVEVI
jgi:hypothetical protein